MNFKNFKNFKNMMSLNALEVEYMPRIYKEEIIYTSQRDAPS